MRVARTSTVTILREEYFAEGVPGRYIIDAEGRWYEVFYSPYPYSTTWKREQIIHTDLHEKAIAAIEADAAKRRAS